uniref:Uncharacterized protein n=1 Tax=Rhipicephalus appendiculatus TaxID=34631 RepID=A0A131YE70_RHIAP
MHSVHRQQSVAKNGLAASLNKPQTGTTDHERRRVAPSIIGTAAALHYIIFSKTSGETVHIPKKVAIVKACCREIYSTEAQHQNLCNN